MQHTRILYLSIVVALGGFLFGFDAAVISGAEGKLQSLWNTSNFIHGLVMSAALWGTVIGAILGSIPTNRYGRKKTLLSIGILFFVSAVGSSLAPEPYSFAIFRLLGGLGIGLSTVAAPAYVSEIAPPAQRGRLVALYQFNIVFGILIAYLSNYLLKDIGPNAWRWMLGVEAVPALIYTLLIFPVPESPRWLLLYRKNRELAIQVMRSISPNLDHEQEIQTIEREYQASQTRQSIFSPQFRKALLLAFFIAFFNQLSGINAVVYYAPRIFGLTNLGENAAFLSTVGLGLVNLVFTMVGISLIDRFGRKKLMITGSIGYIVSLSLVTLFFGLDLNSELIPYFFFLFIAAHAIGQGAVIWVFISEIFPNQLRAAGAAFGSSVHWVLAAVILALGPVLLSSVGPAPVFGTFALLMVFQLLWVLFFMPETKGKSLENLADQLSE